MLEYLAVCGLNFCQYQNWLRSSVSMNVFVKYFIVKILKEFFKSLFCILVKISLMFHVF